MAEGGLTEDANDDFCRPRLKETELESCYQHEFPKHDFWEDHFNKDILQQILDWKYNPQPGCHYTVVKDCSQPKTHLKVVCSMCQCDLKCFNVFVSHHRGESHKKIMKSKVFAAAGVIKSCFRSLREERMYFSEGTLEYMIDTDRKSIVGVSFVFKKYHDKEEAFVCDLCKTFSLKPMIMLKHLESSKHALKYLWVKFHVDAGNQELKDLCEKVMEIEGRINHSIHSTSRPRKVLPDLKKIAIVKKQPEIKCKNTEEGVRKKVETRLDNASQTLIDSLRELSKCAKEVYDDQNNWDFILHCLFVTEMRLSLYFRSKENLRSFEYNKKINFYLGQIHKYKKCTVLED